MTRTIFAALAVLALAGCGPAAPPPANEATEAEAAGNAVGENVLAKVLELPDAQRDMVFIRALLDANLRCDGVVRSVRLPDQDGLPLWRAECKNGESHMISITTDGTARIVSRTGR